MRRGGVGVSPLNIGVWRDFPLRDRLRELTGLEVFVDNDAKALALAEGWRGAAVGVSDYVGMVVSTGVGGGIVLVFGNIGQARNGLERSGPLVRRAQWQGQRQGRRRSR